MSAGDTRAFGPFAIAWRPTSAPQPLVHVELSVVGELLWAGDLLPAYASQRFDAALNAYSAAGLLTVGWLDPGALHGQLVGSDCRFSAPSQLLGFSGTIAVW